MALYCVCAVLIYWIGGDQLHFRYSQSDMLTPVGVVGEITWQVVVEQPIVVDGDLTAITFIGFIYARQNTGTFCVEVCDPLGNVLVVQVINVASIPDNSAFSIRFPELAPFGSGVPIGASSTSVGTRLSFGMSSVLYFCFRLMPGRG